MSKQQKNGKVDNLNENSNQYNDEQDMGEEEKMTEMGSDCEEEEDSMSNRTELNKKDDESNIAQGESQAEPKLSTSSYLSESLSTASSSSPNSSSPVAVQAKGAALASSALSANNSDVINNWNNTYTNYASYPNSNIYTMNPAAYSQNFHHFNMIQPLSASSPGLLSNNSIDKSYSYFNNSTNTTPANAYNYQFYNPNTQYTQSAGSTGIYSNYNSNYVTNSNQNFVQLGEQTWS